MKKYRVNGGKGWCYQFGPIELIMGGSVYKYSISFGKALVILAGERNADSNNSDV
jgi:hypothetical protein